MFSPHTVRGHVSQCKASHFALLPVAPRKQNGCVSAQPAAGQQQELRQNISQEILLKLELESSTGSHGCSCRASAVPHPHCHHATLQSVQCHRRSLSCHQQMWIHIVRQLLDSKVSKDGILTGDVAGSQTIHYIHCGYALWVKTLMH